jgi:hypothetical protein
MIEALVHGYQINVRNTAVLQLRYSKAKRITKNWKKMFVFSSRSFEYMFYIYIRAKYIRMNKYMFFTDKIFYNRIKESIDSDNVYQLTKE